MDSIYKPTSPGRRGMSKRDFQAITTSKPVRSLTVVKRSGPGRNNQGKITTRHKGGGAHRFYRLVSFSLPDGFSGKVTEIEYDPNRSANLARIKQADGQFAYILATQGMKIGQKIAVGEGSAIENGNRLALKVLPIGSVIHAIEMQPGKGAQMVRSAGSSAMLMARDNGYAQLRLPSGEVRQVNENCTASIGVVGNEQHQNIKLGKAGIKRHQGIRPSVRGVTMNAVDHPHGGGDGGKHGIGGGKGHGSSPKTPWGQKTLGNKTRRRKSTTKYIIRSRHLSKRGK